MNLVRPIFHLLHARGVRARDLLAMHDLSAEQLDDHEGRVPLDVAYRVMEDAARLLGEPDFGLLMAERGPVGTTGGVLTYALQASTTLRDAFRRLKRLHRLVMDLGHVELYEEGDRAQLVLRLPTSTHEMFRQAAEGCLAAWLRRGRELTGVSWDPLLVRFRHPEPACTETHRRIFRAPIKFCRATDELVLDRSLLDLRVLTADPGLARILDRHAEELIERLPPINDFTGAVRHQVVKSLRTAAPTLDGIAANLRTSARTLQRRLAEEGLTLRRIVDDSRRELAMRYLETPDKSITEVAWLLGFEAVASFHRSFRRWTGVTPAQYRSTARR